MEYKLWRQAYYNTNGELIPAAVISQSNAGKIKFKHSICNNTFYGLKLYDTEEEANKEPFNINNYGR